MSQQVLICFGGWPGHSPKEIANRYADSLKAEGCDVEICEGPECLDNKERLRKFDLFIPCITMAALTPERESALSEAVKGGLGIAGAHGAGDAFRGALTYAHIMGGQFVSHPFVGEYSVRISKTNHPLVSGLQDNFLYNSEQYYLHVDPGNDVLLETDYVFDGKTVIMPVAWTKHWGKGKVFYCALGHKPAEYDEHPDVWNFIIKGALWAMRNE